MSSNGSTDAVVKKRSLSSYLSNVDSRREELEKIKHKEDEDERKRLEQVKREKIEQLRHHEETLKNEMDSQKEQDFDVETPSVEKQDLKQEEAQVIKPAEPSLKEPSEATDDVSYGQINANTTTKNETFESKLNGNTEEHRGALVEPLYKRDLHSQLKEPEHRSFVDKYSKEEEDTNDAIMTRTKSTQGFAGNDGNNRSDDDDEIDSDAPTEPASPPMPRRGRLVRGDKLSSLSPRNVFDNDSDSELSDIEELKSVHLSSSILHGDSSPTRQSQRHHKSFHVSSSPNKSPQKKPKSHIAISKVPKQKKSVYRDAGGRTRLQIACDKGNYELAKKLVLEDDYDVNDQDNAGNTALHEAALNGHLELVRLLAENGADVNIQSFEMFKDTPLIDASANGHLDVVSYLLDHGADPTISNAKGLTAYESIEEDSDLDEQEREIVREIKSNLRAAARKRNHVELSNRRLSDNSGNSGGRSSPSHAKPTDELLGEFEFFWTDITSKSGRGKLFKASKEGKLAYVGAYLENGGRVDVKSFLEAVKVGHEDITSLFLAFGAQANAALKDGTTALMLAVGRGHVGTVKLLLDAGANPTKKNKKGYTALYYAQNSPMGVIDDEEIGLLKEGIKKHGEDIAGNTSFNGKHSDGRMKLSRESNTGSENDDVDNDTGGEIKDTTAQKNGQAKGIASHGDHNQDHEDADDADDADDAEDIVNVGRKRKTLSPMPLSAKRQTLSPELTSGVAKPETIPKKINPEIKTKPDSEEQSIALKVNEETAEEKEQRLKAEEEYIQRRLQNKKKKEQELLKKLAHDAEKRKQEKSKQKIEEAKRIERQQKEREWELNKQKQEAELSRRREIRALYPLGLKLIDFQNQTDYTDYLPLYYIERSTSDAKHSHPRYVLDLQACIVLKDQDILTKEPATRERIDVSSSHRQQIWNVLRFILLYGGNHNSYTNPKQVVDFQGNDLETRIEIEAAEYNKFLNLPLHWVRWDHIAVEDSTKRKIIEQEMTPLSLVEPSPAISATAVSSVQSKNDSRTQPKMMAHLPTKFQHRPSTSWIADPTKLRQIW